MVKFFYFLQFNLTQLFLVTSCNGNFKRDRNTVLKIVRMSFKIFIFFNDKGNFILFLTIMLLRKNYIQTFILF